MVSTQLVFFVNDPAPTEFSPLSPHAAFPICEEDLARPAVMPWASGFAEYLGREPAVTTLAETMTQVTLHSTRSEEHTSELQSRQYLVCRLLLEQKNLRGCLP